MTAKNDVTRDVTVQEESETSEEYMPDTPESLTPESLKKRRRAVLLTQQQLADIADVDRAMIANFESERRPILTAQNEKKVLDALVKFEAEFKDLEVRRRIVLSRIEAGLTQEVLAKLAGISTKDYALWEAGQHTFSDPDIARIEDAINATEKGRTKFSTLRGKLAELADPVGLLPLTKRVAHRERTKEHDRVFGIMLDQRIEQDEQESAAEDVDLNSLLVEQNAKIAELEKQLAKLKGRKRRKK